MARFLLRSVLSTLVTMLLVSVLLWLLLDIAAGDVTVKLLGVFATTEQRASYRAQLGLDASSGQRYLDWLIGSDWRAAAQVGLPLVTFRDDLTGEQVWWAEQDGAPTQWLMAAGELTARRRQPDGRVETVPAAVAWVMAEDGSEYFWGVDDHNNAVKWVRGQGAEVWVLTDSGLRREGDGPQQYIPLRKGLLRGDAGMSLQTGRPVSVTLFPRLRNSLVLAAVAFAVVMPLALLLGIVAGVNEGKAIDRAISVAGLTLTATPEFVTGLFLIMIFGIWLKWVPAVAIFTSPNAIFENPALLVLPVMTLTAAELGYVARMTRASMVEIMGMAYIRTAIIKGMPFRRVVMRHAVRNALLAPITIIMLHVNWLIGGLVVVEVIFGFPGLGQYIYDAAVFGDYNAIEAAAMILVVVAVGTRLLGDFFYTLLNPRIRYS
ncbi:putative ABC transporter permease protein [Candidatus Promineifilum breve]|uniref:ABC transporter permease protein n=1 Tax=Candidatus Promineifilum breve TaxID=1806508 RepID=A0A160SXV9_9CHLR|nr:ABC transporter permease [Candidatus Promineifilum breve]CUS02201.2 putative ABC transporter permease protein [Candidatus Promineifilum breve]